MKRALFVVLCVPLVVTASSEYKASWFEALEKQFVLATNKPTIDMDRARYVIRELEKAGEPALARGYEERLSKMLERPADQYVDVGYNAALNSPSARRLTFVPTKEYAAEQLQRDMHQERLNTRVAIEERDKFGYQLKRCQRELEQTKNELAVAQRDLADARRTIQDLEARRSSRHGGVSTASSATSARRESAAAGGTKRR